MIITVQKPWDGIVADLTEYRRLFKELHGTEAPKPIVGTVVVCDRDGERARETAHRYVSSYYESVVAHYDLGGTQFKGTKGYEYYENMAAKVRKYPTESGAFFADLQVWGTPEQCFEKISCIRQQTGCEGFLGIFDTADLPFEQSARSMKLFAAEVMPRLQAIGDSPGSPAIGPRSPSMAMVR
jgi:alkanesulfonate monooxygenase SsuD/methylene tetrahydromethanopterin reductase-like flavin-dependent oxidoreductase (luciferase family)